MSHFKTLALRSKSGKPLSMATIRRKLVRALKSQGYTIKRTGKLSEVVATHRPQRPNFKRVFIGLNTWLYVFKSQAALDAWKKQNSHRAQVTDVFLNNGFGLEVKVHAD